MLRIPVRLLTLSLTVALLSCTAKEPTAPTTSPTSAEKPETEAATETKTESPLQAYLPEFHQQIAADAKVEQIADGFTWSEGPAWLANQQALLFTDVPANTLYRWSQRDGLQVLLKPSGFVGQDDGSLREAGANGLFAEPAGTVLLADSGNRLLARLDPVSKQKTVLAERYQGKRFNSPNDAVRRADGRIYFTDPPYGLAGIEKSPLRELAFSGVFRLDPDGSVHLIEDGLHFPNGVALSPDGNTLYVANSDPDQPIWMVYSLDANGAVTARRELANARDLLGEGVAGLPDGLTVAADGTLFASAPGGLLVMRADGTRLGRLLTGAAVSNAEFGDDGTLYLTSHQRVLRVPVKAKGQASPPRD
ncbi:SMP-30/gluconolactonase/LRE family protein [Pseudoxanthomonas indica]|uniref:Gluconolactonase n=1 Tax=Pseudoxanthomonas indica TaxID=428993 RepID=A0A1T5K8W0_9GAMM|nr:SMP-30/gluconolactonase/LRE family protein [Pseudoxanthomonas indica]GGD47582.1 gluconolactonase [Pseudoxanthomonas indica]SKC60126.1 gluconolactonase [Pseudoxanthomonas indica]